MFSQLLPVATKLRQVITSTSTSTCFQGLERTSLANASRCLHTTPALFKKEAKLISRKKETRHPWDPNTDWSFLKGPAPRGDVPISPVPESLKNTPGFGAGGGAAPPFTFTSDLFKRNNYLSRSKYMMMELEYEECLKISKARNIPEFRVGDVIELSFTQPMNEMKVETFVGICYKRRNRGMGSSFDLMNYMYGMVIERGWPLYSPHIVGMKILERRATKNRKLYWYRHRRPAEWAVPFKEGNK